MFFKRDHPKVAVNPDILSVEQEPSSAVHRTPNPEVAKHLTVVIREEYRIPPGEVLIVCAALLRWAVLVFLRLP